MSDRTLARVGSVAWREFRHTALTKAFLFGAVILPIIMIGLMTLVPALMISQLQPLDGRLAVIDGTGRFAPALQSIVEDPSATSLPAEAQEQLEELGAAAGAGPLSNEVARAATQTRPKIVTETFPADTDLEERKLAARDGDWLGVLTVPAAQLVGSEAPRPQ